MLDKKILEDARESLFWTGWRLQLTIPSMLARGEEFSLRVTAIGRDGLPSDAFDRRITFEASPGIDGVPRSVAFAPGNDGRIVVDGLRAVGPSHAYVVARPEGAPGSVASNPAWVSEAPPYQIYWGDLHVHTSYSNCWAWACKPPAFCYAYAREVSDLDFAAAADHLHGIASAPSRWPELQRLARDCNKPQEFATFLAFESSHKSGFGGDNNAYFLEDDAPHFWMDHPDMRKIHPEIPLRELWKFLDATGKEYFTVPHHTGRARKYRSFADPVYNESREPLFEIYSGWGSSEMRGSRFPLFWGNSDKPCYFQDALRAGCRFGVIASSDDHVTMPGSESQPRLAMGRFELGWHLYGGLAAVRAHDLSREALWNALRAKNCYATTHTRTLLEVRIGDLTMGQNAPVSRQDPLRAKREIRVNTFTTASDDAEVVLIRNGEEFGRKVWRPTEPEIVFADPTPLDEIAIRGSAFRPDPFVFYYVRVEDRYGQTQWSSPIWLDLDA